MVPTELLPPATPFTRQLTAFDLTPATVAVNAFVLPPAVSVALVGEMVTTGPTIVTLADADFDASV
jgi:hypothetical protein